jgi:Cdc6-like AAA superfamily ATPase
MSLQIHEKHNKLEVNNSANNLDKPLAPELPEPLPNYNGFCWVVAGPSGSGKTTLLASLMSQKKKDGKHTSYRKLFDRIIICSNTLGNGTSLKKDPFKDIPESQKFKKFDFKAMQEIYEMCENNHEEEENTVVIFDDVGSQLRKDHKAEKLLVSFLQNRRHMWVSVFILVQKFRDIPTGIRNNMSHFSYFRPKNQLEVEAIGTELMPFHKKHYHYVFDNDDKFSFMTIDMSLKHTNKFIFYNGFNRMVIQDTENNINA